LRQRYGENHETLMGIVGVLAETQTRHLLNINQKSWCHCYSAPPPNSVVSDAVLQSAWTCLQQWDPSPHKLRLLVGAPWYVPNTVIRKDLQIPTVTEEIRRYSSQYSARLSAHPNALIVNLIELPDNSRLRRYLPNDLSTRFLVQF
jgi:hypothetical protein